MPSRVTTRLAAGGRAWRDGGAARALVRARAGGEGARALSVAGAVLAQAGRAVKGATEPPAGAAASAAPESVAAENGGEVNVVDVGDPARKETVRPLGTGRLKPAPTSAQRLGHVKSSARSACSAFNVVFFLSIATLGSTVVDAQAPAFTQVASFKVPGADTVEISGAHAYVAGGKTLTIHDLSNPAAPKQVSAYNFPEQIWSFRVVGQYAYVAANFFGLGILDISKPATPTLKTSIKTPGQAKAVAILGSTVFVADHMSGVDIIDLTKIEKPVSVGSFFLDGYARDVTASGSFGYAVDSPTGLYVIDPKKHEQAVGQLQSANAPQVVEVMERPGQPPIVCVIGGGVLQLYDVSKPAAPVRLSTVKTPGGRPGRVTFKGSLAYVTDGREGLQVIDLRDPAKPAVVANFKTALPARDVAVGDSFVLVATGMGEGNEEVIVLRQQ
jgi:hypothetical protein